MKKKLKLKKITTKKRFLRWYQESMNMIDPNGRFLDCMCIPFANILIGIILTFSFPFLLIGYLFCRKETYYEEV